MDDSPLVQCQVEHEECYCTVPLSISLYGILYGILYG
jgi:hypothetical protein